MMRNANVEHPLSSLRGLERTDVLFSTLNLPQILDVWEVDFVTRVELAQATN
ncbi:hypothetical protein [Paraburkholderia flava]|uniref:hypothetical protein n=1 Tax=Paraburkholderia flava TaxID=2547393 RepID=UPI001414E92B|nr:hypothetical protein [Paraburkholderia flava]